MMPYCFPMWLSLPQLKYAWPAKGWHFSVPLRQEKNRKSPSEGWVRVHIPERSHTRGLWLICPTCHAGNRKNTRRFNQGVDMNQQQQSDDRLDDQKLRIKQKNLLSKTDLESTTKTQRKERISSTQQQHVFCNTESHCIMRMFGRNKKKKVQTPRLGIEPGAAANSANVLPVSCWGKVTSPASSFLSILSVLPLLHNMGFISSPLTNPFRWGGGGGGGGGRGQAQLQSTICRESPTHQLSTLAAILWV